MTKSELVKKLKTLKSALIFCHARPDGDTLSSAFSLKYAFEKLGKRAEVVCSDPIPNKYKAFTYLGELAEIGDGYDAHIAVDVASEMLMGGIYDFYRKHKETIAIDHHVSNTRYAKDSYVNVECANAVNVYEIICELGVEFDEKLANLCYLGLCTDTGNFAHTNTDKKAFMVATKLVEYGVKPGEVYTTLFKSQSKGRAMLYAHVIGGMKFYHDDKVAIITTRLSDLERFGVDFSVTEGFIDFPLTVGSVEIAIAILEKADKQFKVSFRSKKYVDVNALANTFGGGGHVRASGAVICGYYEDVLDKLLFNTGNYLE